MFSQDTVNPVVSYEIIMSVAVVVLAGLYCLYRWIDYKLFCRRLEKSHREEQAKTRRIH